MATDDEIRSWIFRRAQDWGVVAALIVSVLTILAFLLPIYRKQVIMEDSLISVVKWQAEYAPKIEAATIQNAVVNTKIDNLSQQVGDISRRLEPRHSFRYSPQALQRTS